MIEVATMSHQQIQHCESRIAEEEQLARSAQSAEVAERHHQMAMLYKAQLAVLKRSWLAVPKIAMTERDGQEARQSA